MKKKSYPKLKKYPDGGKYSPINYDDYYKQLNSYKTLPVNPKTGLIDTPKSLRPYAPTLSSNLQMQQSAMNDYMKAGKYTSLTPEQGSEALTKAGYGNYDEYLKNANAWEAYRNKTVVPGQKLNQSVDISGTYNPVMGGGINMTPTTPYDSTHSQKMFPKNTVTDIKPYKNGGLKRSKDYGSEENPYPNIQATDFAGGNRSYPIPTKADAIDALRLAGLHGRSDVRNKVFSKYPSLKKYEDGGETSSMMKEYSEYNPELYNPADPNRQSQPNYGQYAQVGMAGLGAYQAASNMEEGNAGDKRTAGTEAGVEAGLTAATPWYGYAKQASNFGKSFVPRNEDGTAKTATGETASRMMTPTHTQAINSAKEGNYGMAAANILGMGNVMSAYGSIDNKTKFGKFTNKLLDEDTQYAMGGINYSTPNAEVEKQELMRMPNGSTQQVNGPSHENGGVAVNIPTGTQIFSDRLKNPETKKTFAKEASKYKIKEGEKLSATEQLKNSLRQRKLDQIFQAQESLKQEKVQKYAEKMGVVLPGQHQMPDGSMMNNSEMRNGGTKLPKYWGGAIFSEDNKKPTVEDTQFNPDGTYKSGMTDDQYAAMVDADIAAGEFTPDSKERDYSNMRDNAGLAANILGQNVGNIADLYMTRFGKKYDKESYGQLTPQKLDPTQALIDADIQNKITRGALAGAAGGNAGAYMSNAIQAGAQNALAKARIRMGYDKENTDIFNKFLPINKQLEMQEISDTKQNKARSEDIARTAARGISTNTAAAIRDYKLGKADKYALDIIGKAYPDYEYDNKKRIWKHKVSGKKLEV